MNQSHNPGPPQFIFSPGYIGYWDKNTRVRGPGVLDLLGYFPLCFQRYIDINFDLPKVFFFATFLMFQNHTNEIKTYHLLILVDPSNWIVWKISQKLWEKVWNDPKHFDKSQDWAHFGGVFSAHFGGFGGIGGGGIGSSSQHPSRLLYLSSPEKMGKDVVVSDDIPEKKRYKIHWILTINTENRGKIIIIESISFSLQK